MVRNIKKYILLGTSTMFSMSLSAQSLPDQWSVSPDGRMITIGKNLATGYYDSSLIRSVYLDFPQANYWTQLLIFAGNTEIPAVLTVDGVTYDTVGVRFRGNTSQINAGQKRSFKISVDYKDPNQKLMGYKSLKLNNGNQDRSHLREVFYAHQSRRHIPAPKANYVHLFLNNVDWGIYPNIQQMNKDYLEEWFVSNDGVNLRADRPTGPGGGWGDGTAALNYVGPDTSIYQIYYTLKSSDLLEPWNKLVVVCSTLNNSGSSLATNLPAALDVDRALWFLATEIAWTDDDSYVMKGKMDYYVYYEPETGRMAPLEYDGNSTMVLADTSAWSPFYHETNVNYPLLNKILAIPAWRQRYLAHMRTIIQDEMDTTSCFAILDNYKNQIDQLVSNDPKKIYSYAQFTSEQNVLKTFIRSRRRNLLNNAEIAEVAPVISGAVYTNQNSQPWTPPVGGEAVNVTAVVNSPAGVHQVNLYYAPGLVGNFTAIPMYDDGAHNDNAAGDGIFGASIPGQTPGNWVRWYIEAASNNTAKSVSYLPVGAEHDVFYYLVTTTAGSSPVVVNEVMSSNTSYMPDNAGDFDDWVELYNTSAAPVDISGYYLTDNLANLNKWTIPNGTVIPGNGYLTFWADEDSSQGWNHMNFKLSAQNEFVWLLNNNLEVLDSVGWSGGLAVDSGYARIPNGTGSFIIKNPTFGYNNQSLSAIASVARAALFTVYPNPAADVLQVMIPDVRASETLEVSNALGQIIFLQAARENNVINTSAWAAGTYLIRYGTEVQKVVVRH